MPVVHFRLQCSGEVAREPDERFSGCAPAAPISFWPFSGFWLPYPRRRVCWPAPPVFTGEGNVAKVLFEEVHAVKLPQRKYGYRGLMGGTVALKDGRL